MDTTTTSTAAAHTTSEDQETIEAQEDGSSMSAGVWAGDEPTNDEGSCTSRDRKRVLNQKLKSCLALASILIILVSVVASVSISLAQKNKRSTTQGQDKLEGAEEGAAAGSPRVAPGGQTTTASPTISPKPRTSSPTPPPCAAGGFYYTYNNGKDIGFVDVSSMHNHEYVSTPDCGLFFLSFDVNGAAYGHCDGHPGSLVTVDLRTGNTTKIADFPTAGYAGLAYNPTDDHFYTSVDNFDATVQTYSLVRVEKNGTFTPVGNARSLHQDVHGFTIDALGNAFATDFYGEKLYSINLTTGTSTLLGTLPFDMESSNIAFYGSTLYAMGYYPPAPLFTIRVTNGTTVTTTSIKNVNASETNGGAFCPL